MSLVETSASATMAHNLKMSALTYTLGLFRYGMIWELEGVEKLCRSQTGTTFDIQVDRVEADTLWGPLGIDSSSA